MRFMRIGLAELVGLVASATMFISLYLPWFQTDTSNRNSRIGGVTSKKEAITAFVAYDTLQYLLIAACFAPIILALLVLFNKETSWDRGEITAIVGIVALVLVLFNGIIGGRPDDAVSVTLSIGYYLALLASLGIFAGGALRMMEKGPANKPPGV